MPYGPPIPGAPWLGRRDAFAAFQASPYPPIVPVPPPTGRPKVKTKPFLGRIPDFKGHVDIDRLRRAHEILSAIINSLAGTGQLRLIGQSAYSIGTMVETRAPTVTDDLSASIPLGIIWVNSLTQQAYVCVSNAVAAAVWRQI